MTRQTLRLGEFHGGSGVSVLSMSHINVQPIPIGIARNNYGKIYVQCTCSFISSFELSTSISELRGFETFLKLHTKKYMLY